MKCEIKFFNERNPCRLLPTGEAGDSVGTAGDKPEEGGDDVKSSWPLRPGPHTCYNGRYRAKRSREAERIAESRSQYGLESATRLHEVGIASNRASAWRGEYVPYTPPVTPSEPEAPEVASLTERGAVPKVRLVRGVKS